MNRAKLITTFAKTFAKTLLSAGALMFVRAPDALADWRQDLGVFRVGIIENEALKLSPSELERIRVAYADALTMPVEIVRMRDYSALIDAHASSRVEYAIYSATAYSTAFLVCACIEPLVQPIAADGSIGTRTVLMLDPAVKFSQIGASKGIAVPGRNSLNGYGIPLSADKVLDKKLKGTEPWLKFTSNNSTAVGEYVAGTVDGFFTTVESGASLASAIEIGSPLFEALKSSGRPAKAVWLSDVVANGPHAIRKNLASEAKGKLLNFLIDLAQTNPDLNDLLLPANDVKFVPAAHGAYATAINATKMLSATAAPVAQ